MSSRSSGRAWALGALIAALLVPAGMAVGSHDGDPVLAGGDPSVILLTMGRTDQVTWDDLTQAITTKNNDCLVAGFAGDPQILDVTAAGGALGHVKDGFGVFSALDGAGEPCGRVTPGESISVALGAAAADYLMTAVDVDLELKFTAKVKVEYLHLGVEVHEHVFAPMESSDDGPDSKDGDNYRYFHRPMTSGETPQQIYFDEVVFSAVTGAFSLEGGADLVTNDQPVAFGQLEPTSKSSQFEVVLAFDGEITCQDTLEISDDDVPEVSGELVMHSMFFDHDEDTETPDQWVTDNCRLKPYNAGVTIDTLTFIPELADTLARYTIVITLSDEAITGGADGQVTSLFMTYDPEGGEPTTPLDACQGGPVLVDDAGTLGTDEYEEFWTQADTGLLPDGDTACYYSVQLLPSGEGVGTEIWGIYFEDDPSFGFK